MWTSAARSVGLALAYAKQRSQGEGGGESSGSSNSSTFLGEAGEFGRGGGDVSTSDGLASVHAPSGGVQQSSSSYEFLVLSRPDVLHWGPAGSSFNLPGLVNLLQVGSRRDGGGGGGGGATAATHRDGRGKEWQQRKVVLNPHVPDFHPEVIQCELS